MAALFAGSATTRVGTFVLYASLAVTGMSALRFTLHAEYPHTTVKASGAIPRVFTPSAIESAKIKRAADADPFHPGRTRAAEPPGPPAATQAQPSTIPEIRLLGTVINENDAFAMIEQPGNAAALVRSGDTIAGWKIKTLTPGRAVVAFDDSTIVLTLPGHNP